MDKGSVVQTRRGVLLSPKKGYCLVVCSNTDGCGGHWVRGNQLTQRETHPRGLTMESKSGDVTGGKRVMVGTEAREGWEQAEMSKG